MYIYCDLYMSKKTFVVHFMLLFRWQLRNARTFQCGQGCRQDL